MGKLPGLPWKRVRKETFDQRQSGSQPPSLQDVVHQQSRQLQQQESDIQRMAETLAAITGSKQASNQPPENISPQANQASAFSTSAPQQLQPMEEPGSVSSRGGMDWRFAPKGDLDVTEELRADSLRGDELSRYESTLEDNMSGLPCYAPSVASSNGTSVAASHMSYQEHNAVAGHVKRMQPKFDNRVRQVAVIKLLKAAMVDAQVRQLIGTPDSIQCLLNMLLGSDIGCRDAAIHLLWILSRDAMIRRQIAQEDFVGGAVQLLHESSHSTARATASLIHNCAVTDRLKAEVASAGGVCALVRLLFECDAAVAQAAAATALQGLATGSPQIRKEMIQAGAIPGLVGILRQGWSRAAQPAARTLQTLCEAEEGREDTAEQALSAGAVDLLLDLLKTATPGCQAAAAAALRSLVQNAEVQDRLLSGRRVLPLVDIVRSGTVEGQVAAAAVIRALAQSGERARANILAAGAAEALVDLAASSDTRSSTNSAALTLLSLAQGEDCQHALIIAGSVRTLVEVLAGDNSLASKEAAARALTNLTVPSAGKAAMQGLGATSLLMVSAAQAPTAGLAMACSGVIHNLARIPALRPGICYSPSLAGFIALAGDADSEVSDVIVHTLDNLAGKGADVSALVAAGAAELLLEIMATCTVIERYDGALSALNRLVAYDVNVAAHISDVANKLMHAHA